MVFSFQSNLQLDYHNSCPTVWLFEFCHHLKLFKKFNGVWAIKKYLKIIHCKINQTHLADYLFDVKKDLGRENSNGKVGEQSLGWSNWRL